MSRRARREGGAVSRRRWLYVTAAVLAPVTAGVAVPLAAVRPAAAASCPPPPTTLDHAGLVGWGSSGSGQVTETTSSSPVLTPVQVGGLTDNLTRAGPQPGGDARRWRAGVGEQRLRRAG
jgi:hypothetical protein